MKPGSCAFPYYGIEFAIVDPKVRTILTSCLYCMIYMYCMFTFHSVERTLPTFLHIYRSYCNMYTYAHHTDYSHHQHIKHIKPNNRAARSCWATGWRGCSASRSPGPESVSSNDFVEYLLLCGVFFLCFVSTFICLFRPPVLALPLTLDLCASLPHFSPILPCNAARTVYGDHDRYRNVYLRPYSGKHHCVLCAQCLSGGHASISGLLL